MRLALLYPEWDRPCSSCEKYRLDEAPDRRTGVPMLRPPGTPTPCGSCEKVPEHLRRAGMHWRDLRKHAVEMTPANRRAWEFYRGCRATGRFPDDPLVRWYSAVIQDEVDRAARRPVEELAAAVTGLVATLRRR